MSSVFTYPSQLLDNNGAGRIQEPPRNTSPHDPQTHQHNPYHLSPNARGDSTTPADSVSSIHYQSSDFSELDADQDLGPHDGGDFLFNLDFNNDAINPGFLNDPSLFPHGTGDVSFGAQDRSSQGASGTSNGANSLLSPEQTPSVYTSSPELPTTGSNPGGAFPDAALPMNGYKGLGGTSGLSITPHGFNQFTPDTTSEPSSESSSAPTLPQMQAQSPRVTVSMWGGKNEPQNPPSMFSVPYGPTTTTAGEGVRSVDDSFIPNRAPARDESGAWQPNSGTGPRGIDPSHRSPMQVASSANDLESRREADRIDEERNHHVGNWLSGASNKPLPAEQGRDSVPPMEGVSDREIPLGHQTMNTMKGGSTYLSMEGGEMNQEDVRIMRENRNWEDAPVILPITQADTFRYQPETSMAAIQRLERMMKDTDSTLSRQATWGTRRRSLPSIADMEGITSGNLLKKLAISPSHERRPSILGGLKGLIRRPSASQLLKRARGVIDDEATSPEQGAERRDSQNLAPPSRTSSWGKKTPKPSLNTALVSMGTGVAAIGTTHARSGSISTSPPMASPKSPFPSGLTVPRFGRQRSKSAVEHPTLVTMWKKTGGPPVASLAKTTTAPEQEDDDDDDDDLDDSEMRVDSDKLMEDITPTFSGFQQHVLKLNPALADSHQYLVDRIAHQQVIRYKSLLTAKVKHLNLGNNCSCGEMCIALGGRANILDPKGGERGLDPLSAHIQDISDGDMTPLEGAISTESFPADIPMPPTQSLPAEFECQLCYQAKKFTKPSDWTKHVHEDVQPFTCTWDRCRDPKIFKRKADWVRHENEGHRHLEWWICDVEECRHVCYRRDNFLQHLVREHKFPEPKVKTKAAIKKAGGGDPTWRKVENCHIETNARAQDEPCRFCGKTFPTWKKLTVHLAKHMEQISLPVLRLVARKQLEPDTIISPVQDPPPRSFAPLPIKQEAGMPLGGLPPYLTGNPSAYGQHQPMTSGAPFLYGSAMPPHVPSFQQSYYTGQYDGLPQQTMQNLDASMSVPQISPPMGYPQQGFHQGMPATSGPGFVSPQHNFHVPMSSSGLEPFPQLQMTNPLGLQDPNMAYDQSMVDQTGAASAGHYTPQGSASPYSRSPHQGGHQFYPQ